jgi:hypothetical protein
MKAKSLMTGPGGVLLACLAIAAVTASCSSVSPSANEANSSTEANLPSSERNSKPARSTQTEKPSRVLDEPSLGIKEITELTSEELEVANGICQKALQEHFGKTAIAWYQTTYHYLPTSDEELFPESRQDLQTPVTLVSVSVFTAHDFPETQRKLKETVGSLEAYHGGRRFRIYKSLVVMNPGGGGGSIGMSYDLITIIPYRVIIF